MVEIFENVKIGTHSCAIILRILTIYIVINILHSGIAAYARDNILPVCIVLRGTMLLFLVVFFSRSESGAPCVRGVHSSNTHCVAVYT